MQPVRLEDALSILEDKSCMLLNVDLLGVHYLNQLITLEGEVVTTRGGKTLPIELWNRILSYASANPTKPFSFVQAMELRDSPKAKVLRCRKLDLFRFSPCGEPSFGTSDTVFEFEEFMKKPHNAQLPSTVSIVEAHDHQQHQDTFDILMMDADKNLPVGTACLFFDLTVPDVIARREGGACWICANGRFICPGCTRGIAQRFEVFMGCGVALACPLCLGVNFSRGHREFLRHYYRDEPPEEEKKEIDGWVQGRLDEFGYQLGKT